MTDYISREEVLKAIHPRYAPAINKVLAGIIESVPAADVVSVVRCKDCINRGKDDCPMHINETEPDEDFLLRVDNDYCSYGKEGIKMHLIDADALIKGTKERYCSGCNSYNGVRCRACWVDDMQRDIEDAPAVNAIPADVLRSLFIKRMTVDSETNDRRRKDYNQAIFGYLSDGSTYPKYCDTDMDMVLECFDNACKDYFAGNIAKEKKER